MITRTQTNGILMLGLAIALGSVDSTWGQTRSTGSTRASTGTGLGGRGGAATGGSQSFDIGSDFSIGGAGSGTGLGGNNSRTNRNSGNAANPFGDSTGSFNPFGSEGGGNRNQGQGRNRNQNFGNFGGFNQGFGGLGQGFGGGNRFGQGGQNQRPRYAVNVAFDAPKVAAPVLTQAVETNFRAVASPGVRDVNIMVNDAGIATLRGAATSDRNAKLAAALLALEPGVRRVDNQLQVSGSSPASP